MITVFTTTTCASCKMVKRYMDSKQHSYTEVNLDEHPEERARVSEYTDALSVPVTIIETDDGRDVVVGWQPSQLIPALMRMAPAHA